jgi:hypothetical protein
MRILLHIIFYCQQIIKGTGHTQFFIVFQILPNVDFVVEKSDTCVFTDYVFI